MAQNRDSWSRGEQFAAFVLVAAFFSVMIPAAIKVANAPLPAVTHSQILTERR